LMVYAYVHDPAYLYDQRGSGKIDYAGLILITVGLGLFQIVLGRGGQDGWFAAQWVRYGTAASVLAIIALVMHELHFPEPILDLRLFGILRFSITMLVLSLQGLALWTVNLLNPLFLENVLHYDAWRAGLAVAPRGLGVVVALLVVGQLSRRLSEMRPFVFAGLLVGAYEVYRMSHWTIGMRESEVLWPIFLFGLGLGGVFPIVTALGIGQISRERMGFASSLFSMMINTGAAAGIAIGTGMLTARHRYHEAQLLASMPASHVTTSLGAQAWLYAYNDVYRAMAILLVLLTPWVIFLKRTSVDTQSVLSSE
jgi:DHA2 family multidrug resistance protein